jgi:hypothetical protein
MRESSAYKDRHRILYLVGIIGTVGVLFFFENSLIILAALLLFWLFLFFPLTRSEVFIFLFSSLFFLGQNYAVLATGGFSFKHKDILLMPYYEPFLWGFYYLTIKRFIAEPSPHVSLEKKAILGLVATGISFSLFSKDSDALLISSVLSTCLLLLLFHKRYDFLYAACALVLGFIIELFGVSTGLWTYPDPDFLGIPFWFATMWISVGLLGRRFLIPLAERLFRS